MFNKTAEDAIFTFQYRDGEKQGQYQRVVGYKDWDFMNNQNPNGKQQKYWRDNVSQYIESQDGWKVWRRLVAVSHNWNPETTFKHMYVSRSLLNRAMTKTFIIFTKNENGKRKTQLHRNYRNI